jgi:putative Mg2+ transporter-C (MgtC) family protein
MTPHLTLQEAAIRLALTLLASGLIGLNREVAGHAAGFRTTILVSLAASLAMMQMQVLLAATGKTPSSFGVMDMMRLPLGILSGMGFIGAGAILRRGNLVIGVTTAATLWVVTVLGLLFGGGQIWLGVGGTLLAAGVLWMLKRVDDAVVRLRRATMTVRGDTAALDVSAVKSAAKHAQYHLELRDIEHENRQTSVRFLVRWRGAPHDEAPAGLLSELTGMAGVTSVRWFYRTE